MSKKNRHIEHLTPELIKAYRNGELTREEQHEVERLMLENPFYEDALEGLDEFTDEMLDADLNELDNRLEELLAEDEQKAGFWTIWRGVAAAVLIIITVGSLILLKQDKPLPSKLLTENTEPNSADTIQEESSVKSSTDTLNPDSNVRSSDSSTDPKTESQPTEDSFEKLISEKAQEPELDIQQIEADTKALSVETLAQLRKDSIDLIIPMNKLDAQMEKAIAEAQAAEALQGRVTGLRIQAESQMRQSLTAPAPTKAEAKLITVKGLVTDSDDGLPLPQVTIFIEGTTDGTATNPDGKFVLDSVEVGSNLTFRYLGYITQSVIISNTDSLKIKLEPDATALGEVVVSGYGIEEKKEISYTVNRAQPIQGYPAFNQYLKNNLNYPENARAENVRGRVTVEFTVEADGSLSNFEIIKGLGYGCDEEAIRLIKEGPKWQPKIEGDNKVDSKVKVRIRFRP